MISLNNVDYAYTKGTSVFTKLNLNLEKGKVYGLLGKNGVGKSTLLKLIAGGIFPRSGTVHLGDFIPSNRKPQMYQEIFYLPEHFVENSLSIASYVKVNAGFYPKFHKERMYDLLNLLEVNINSKIQNLSYGQTKKFYIAFGLACQTKYIFLDEPTNGLDIPSKSQFRKILASNVTEDQIVIISTHQVKDLTNLIEAIIIIDDGEILLSKELYELENKLQFQHSYDADLGGSSIYKERTAGGYMHVSANVDNEPSEIDLEILFNTVLHKKEDLFNILND